jgi:hypothetical protein
MREKDDEIKRLMVELETANKSIYDKERMVKQNVKEVQHLEGNQRVNKTKLQEIIE